MLVFPPSRGQSKIHKMPPMKFAQCLPVKYVYSSHDTTLYAAVRLGTLLISLWLFIVAGTSHDTTLYAAVRSCPESFSLSVEFIANRIARKCYHTDNLKAHQLK
jgi:hypothetical protein